MASRSLRILTFVWVLGLAQGAYSVGEVEEQRRQEQTADCSILTNGTISDCNVTNSAAEFVIRSESEPTHTCSPSTCSGDHCPNPQKRSLDNSTLDLISKRGEPANGDWRDPGDYGDSDKAEVREEFICYEIIGASDETEQDKVVAPSAGEETTTYKHIIFGGKSGTLAVRGLYGCTSVIVISRRGAWASHIWEKNFNPSQTTSEEFQKVISKIHEGGDTDNHVFGIDQLMNQADAGPRGVIFGDDTDAENNLNIKVIVVTPRPRAPYYMQNERGVRVNTPNSLRDSTQINFGEPPIYGERLEVIMDDLEGTFGQNVAFKTITYAPRIYTTEESQAIEDAKANPEKETRLTNKADDRLKDLGVESARGKVLIQYRPHKGCRNAGWRIFVEGDKGDRENDQWNGSPAQQFTREE